MSVNLKVTIIAVAIAAIGGGGYFTYSTMSNRQEVINEHLDKFSKNLPSQFKFQKEAGEDNLFSSSGAYRLSFISPLDKKYNGSILINYEASHNLTSLFTGETNFVGTTQIEGSILKELKLKLNNNIFTKLEGTIDSKGNLSMKETSEEIGFTFPISNRDVSFKIKPFSKEINYISSSGEINQVINFSEIKGTDSVDSNVTYLLKNTEIKYDSNINKLKHNKLGIKISLLDIPSEHIKAEGISINKNSEEKAKKTIITFDSKINKLNSINYKDATVELKSSLNDFNKDLFNVYQDILPIYISNRKILEHKSFSGAVNGGFTYNIDMLSIKSALEKANISGKIEVATSEEGKIFSLADQTRIDLLVDTDSVLLEKFINPNSISTSDNNNVKISINYTDKILKVNDIPTQSNLNDSLIDLLSQIEKEHNLGLSLSSHKVEDNKAHEEIKIESKNEELKVEIQEEVKSDIK